MFGPFDAGAPTLLRPVPTARHTRGFSWSGATVCRFTRSVTSRFFQPPAVVLSCQLVTGDATVLAECRE